MSRETKTHEITVDVVIFTIKKGKLQVLLVQRSKEPFINKFVILNKKQYKKYNYDTYHQFASAGIQIARVPQWSI